MIWFYIFLCSFLHTSSTIEDGHVRVSYKNYKMYEVKGNRTGLEKMMKFLTDNYHIPFLTSTGTRAEILVSPDLVSIVEQHVKMESLQRNIVVDDYSEIIRDEKSNSIRSDGFSWSAYYDVDDIYRYLHNVSKEHSSHARVVVGGRSYEGRQILGIRINTPTRNIKPVMFIESGIHAREWITPATTTYFINQLLTSTDPEIMALRDQFDWHIFPTVNPDGYHYSYNTDRMWRKTRSRSPNGCYGADPNRNWDYNWMNHGSSSNPCDYQVYAGSRPFSEIETRTLAQYVQGLENLVGYVAFHSYAQTLLLPYSDSTEHVDNYDDLKQIGQKSLEYGYAVNKEKYDGPGTAAEILYKASGGSMDWVRHSVGTPLVYTYELRGLYFHWPARRIHEQGDEVTQMMIGLVSEARNLGYY